MAQRGWGGRTDKNHKSSSDGTRRSKNPKCWVARWHANVMCSAAQYTTTGGAKKSMVSRKGRGCRLGYSVRRWREQLGAVGQVCKRQTVDGACLGVANTKERTIIGNEGVQSGAALSKGRSADRRVGNERADRRRGGDLMSEQRKRERSVRNASRQEAGANEASKCGKRD